MLALRQLNRLKPQQLLWLCPSCVPSLPVLGHGSLAVNPELKPSFGISTSDWFLRGNKSARASAVLALWLGGAQAAFSLLQFFNSVRLWDFIEDRESRSAPGADDEVTELGELFMHLSGAEEDPTAAQ